MKYLEEIYALGGFNPDQPRDPAGTSSGGQFSGGGSGGGKAESHVIEIDHMPGDINKFVSKWLKDRGMNVRDSKVQLLVRSEPGRTWIKNPGESSVTAHG